MVRSPTYTRTGDRRIVVDRIARGCRYGVVRPADGRLAFSTGSAVRVVDAR